MPHLESKTKLIMTASINRYINPTKKCWKIWKYEKNFVPLQHIGAENQDRLEFVNYLKLINYDCTCSIVFRKYRWEYR
jgi:hypothetical protein